MEKIDKYGANVFAGNCEDGLSFSLSTALARNRSPPSIFGFQIYKFKEKQEEIRVYYDPKECGKRIKELRNLHQLTQNQLSE